MMKLHDDPISGNGYKARLLLSFLDLSYTYVVYDILQQETRTSAFLRLNPNGRIPMLELDDGTCIPESNAILCYLAMGTDWLPPDRLTHAHVMSWLFWEQYSHEPNIATLRFWEHLPELTDVQKSQIPTKRENGLAALALMETQLSHTNWLVGKAPTIADIALYAYTHVADEGGYVLSDYPGITAWIERIGELPGYIGITDTPSR